MKFSFEILAVLRLTCKSVCSSCFSLLVRTGMASHDQLGATESSYRCKRLLVRKA